MKLAGKKLTAAVLAGLMSVAMVGGAQAANPIKTVESSGLGSRASLSLHSDGRAVLEAVKGNPDQEQRGFFDASVTTATVGTTRGRDADQNHGTLSTGVGSVTISAAKDGKTSKVKTTAAGGTVFSSAADSHGQTTTIKGGNIKTNEIDANSTITGGSVTSRTYLSADKGVVDRSTEGGTYVKTKDGEKDVTVGQNLKALDTQLTATTSTANSAADGTLTVGKDYFLKKKTANGDGTYSEANIKGIKVDGNVQGNKLTAGGQGIYSFGQVTGKRGFIDQTTKDSTTEYGVVKKNNTVGQNLNALDERVSNVKEYLQNETEKNYVSKGMYSRETGVQDGNVVKESQTVGENIQGLDTALGKETNARIWADKAQDERINTTAENLSQLNQNVADGFNALSAADKAEADAREAGDQKLDTRITDVKEYLQNETEKNYVSKGMYSRETGVQDGNVVKGSQTVGENIQGLDTALGKETNARIWADKAQDERINTTAENLIKLNQNVADGFNALSAQDQKEAQTRAAVDQTLQNQITTNTQAIGATNDGSYVKSANSVGENLNALDAQVGQNSSNIDQLFNDYSSMKKDLNKVGARSAALAGLHAVDYDPANKLSFAVASGNFRNANSVAVGAFYRPNENIMFSAASTMGDSDNAYTFGVSFKLGPSTAKAKTAAPDTAELYKVIGQLQEQLAAQQKEIDQLKTDKAKYNS